MVALHVESIIILATAVEDLGLEVVEVVIVVSLHRSGIGERPCSSRGDEGKKQREKIGELHRGFLSWGSAGLMGIFDGEANNGVMLEL